MGPKFLSGGNLSPRNRKPLPLKKVTGTAGFTAKRILFFFIAGWYKFMVTLAGIL
jgi:hypothetical protein